MARQSFFNWSGGKDSSLALYHVLKDRNYAVKKLMTNVNGEHRRVSMHGVREVLLERQAEAIGIPLQKLILPDQPTMPDYERLMMDTMQQLGSEGFTTAIFGDIFLEDLKQYREAQLAKVHMQAVFPIWKRDTRDLLYEFIDLGFKTIVVCTKAALLDESFCGRIIDRDFLKDLPANVDPCGENGEFHTFVFDGPIFKQRVPFAIGEKVYREYKAPADGDSQCGTTKVPDSGMGFWFCDLLPA